MEAIVTYYIYCADTLLSGLQFLVQNFHSPIFFRKALVYQFPLSVSIDLCTLKCGFIMQIKPLVKPTRAVINFKGLQYAWHDFVSKSMSILLFLQISQCLFFFFSATSDPIIFHYCVFGKNFLWEVPISL